MIEVMVMKLKERAKMLKIDIPAISLALKDKDTPIIAKILRELQVHMPFRQLI